MKISRRGFLKQSAAVAVGVGIAVTPALLQKALGRQTENEEDASITFGAEFDDNGRFASLVVREEGRCNGHRISLEGDRLRLHNHQRCEVRHGQRDYAPCLRFAAWHMESFVTGT